MDTQTYSAKTVQRQLLKLYLILSIIACGAAFLYVYINRTSAEASLASARSADIASQSELTTRWLNSKIALLPGEDVRAFWQTFADKLRGLKKYITEYDRHAKTDRLRDGFQENDFQKYDTPQSHSRWELSKEDTPEINYGFASFYPQKRVASVRPPGNQPPPQKIEEDRERYDRLLGNVAGTFINIDTKNWPASKYSEYMLQDYFHVADVAKKRFPGLSILWIYVVSEGGSLGLYPGNSQTFKGYDLDERLWYRSIFYNEKKSDEMSELIIPNDPSFGLTPPYRDYVSKGFTRTFWHKISDNEIGYSYAICVDLILPLPELPATSTTQGINNEKLLQSAMFGFEIGIGAFVGFVLLSLIFGPTFTNIARFIFIGSLQRNDMAAGELFKVRDTAVVGKDRTKKFSYDWKDEQINQQRTVLTWLFNFKNVIFQVDASRVKQNQVGQGATYEDSFECKDLYRYGVQKWEVYKSRWAGRCRLCTQVVQYEDNLSRVGVLTLKYRDDVKIDATLRGDYPGIDSPSIEKRAEWIASSEISAKPLAEGLLEPPPILCVADRARSVNFIDDIITAYDELTKGRFYIRARYPDDNCIERSKKLFQGKTIQAVCHVRYLEQVLRGGEKSMEALGIGSSITRIILADTMDELVKFLEKDIGGAKCRDLLANFFENYPQILRILALDERQFDINMIIKGKHLDFALVSESSPKFSFLLVSNLAAPGIGPQGFISWRRMDIEFYNYLWDCLNSEAQLRTPEALRNANYL